MAFLCPYSGGYMVMAIFGYGMETAWTFSCLSWVFTQCTPPIYEPPTAQQSTQNPDWFNTKYQRFLYFNL